MNYIDKSIQANDRFVASKNGRNLSIVYSMIGIKCNTGANILWFSYKTDGAFLYLDRYRLLNPVIDFYLSECGLM